MFKFYHKDDLELSGLIYTDYTITVTGQFSFTKPVSDSADFTLRIKNPCRDPSFVTLHKAKYLVD